LSITPTHGRLLAAAIHAAMLTLNSIMLISFVNSLQQQANFSWRPYVTSAFMMHGLTAITDVVANIVGGVSKLPLAKFIDLVGRPQGFVLCLMFIVACKSFQTCANIHGTGARKLQDHIYLGSLVCIDCADLSSSSADPHGSVPERADLLRGASHLLDRHEWCRLRLQHLHRRHFAHAKPFDLDVVHGTPLHRQHLRKYHV
jgi:hypothetical protein